MARSDPPPDDWQQRLRSTVTEYARTVKALEEAREEARSIIETAHDAFISIDADSLILEWNRRAEEIFGWTRADAVGRGLSDTILPAQHRDAHFAGIRTYLRTGQGPLLNRRVEVPAQHRAGHQFPVEMTIWPSAHAQGTRFNAFLHDISERKRGERRTGARYAAVCAMVECDDPEAAVARILEEICVALQWSLGVLWQVDEAAGVLRATAYHARSEQARAFAAHDPVLSMAPGIGLPGKVWQACTPSWLDDFASCDLPRTARAAARGMHGAFAFPVVDGDRVRGVMEFLTHRVEPPDAALLAMMRDIGQLLGHYLGRHGR